jgi:hypothetical protein
MHSQSQGSRNIEKQKNTDFGKEDAFRDLKEGGQLEFKLALDI